MADNEKKLEINDIISLLDKANAALESKIKLPSLVEEIVVHPMNANHTKNIIKSVASGLFSDTLFNVVFFNIMKEIVDAPLESLNVYDKQLLLLYLRSKNISDKIDVDLFGYIKNENGEEVQNKITVTKNISDILKKEYSSVENQVVECPEYTIVVGFPSLVTEFLFEDHLFKNKLSTISDDNRNALKGLVAPFFVYNIGQYIKGLKIGDKEIPLENKKVDERLAIVEKLSANAISKVINTIDEKFGKVINAISSVEEVQDGVKYTGTLKIGAELFID